MTDLEAKPMIDASVTVTGVRTATAHTVRTDTSGRFGVVFIDGEGEYTVLVRKIGYSPALRRVNRVGLSNRITVDVLIGPSAFPLAPLTSRAFMFGQPRGRERASIGGLSQDALYNSRYLDDPSDVNAMVSLLAGVFGRGDSGYSVLGTSPDQNSTLLDGMNFDGNIPPDAQCSIRLAATTSDPSRGQFAGGQTSVTSCRGRDFMQSTLRASVSDPHLGWVDANATMPTSRTILASGFISGAIQPGVAHYHFSESARDAVIMTSTLLTGRRQLLAQLGLSTDTVAALVSALGALHIPLSGPDAPVSLENRQATGQLTVDWASGSSSSWLLSANGTAGTITGLGLAPTALPSAAASSHVANGRIMIRGATYFLGVVDELTGVVSASTSSTSPSTPLADGSVQVGTRYPGGATGIGSLRFGGYNLASRVAGSELNLRNQLSRTLGTGGHQVTFGQQLSVVRKSLLLANDTLGSYTYQSINDLAANQASSYARTLDVTRQANRLTSEALWAGDVWRASAAVSLEGGVRADRTQFGPRPSYNRAVDSLFGVRTDRIPSAVGLSPRLGFAWLIKPLGERTAIIKSTGATMHYITVDASGMSVEPRGNSGAGTTLFGDIGAYRGVLPPGRLTAVQRQTGLPGSVRALTCVGDAVPVADWTIAGGTSFSQCSSGSSGNELAPRPAVSVLDPAFRPPIDWKVNLGLNVALWNLAYAETSLVLLREENSASSIDLNLPRAPRFSLAGEANRPVFVAPSDIVPQSGLIVPSANRVAPEYAAVSEARSDLHRTAVQFNIAVATPSLFHLIPVLVQYSFNSQRNERRGFDETTGGNPFAIELEAGAAPLHQLTISTLQPIKFWWFRSNLRLNLTSGDAYTPVVVGDINGDGLSNDRAFVPVPGSGSDTTLTRELAGLLATTTGSARRCLRSQEGRIAGPNSCRGPWRVQLDFTLDLTPPRSLGQRLHVITSFQNAGAAVLRLLGIGSGAGQGGLPPDGRLLTVTGFDPAQQRFTYRVNPGFGQPFNAGVGTHYLPFLLRVGVEYQLARQEPNPYLHQLGLRSGSAVAPTDTVLRRAIERMAVNPIDTLLALRDTLALTAEQVAQLQVRSARYVAARDSAGESVMTGVAGRGKRLVDNDVFGLMTTYYQVMSQVRVDTRDAAIALLSADQRTKLAALLRQLVTP
ncbi:MAG: carboxypeptidase regulatory-like domain-containing protein [Gemmatimonadales bacterium]